MIPFVTERSAHLCLSIEVDSDPISGSVAVAAGVPQEFCGWIELVAAIEAARHDDATLPREEAAKPA